MAWLMHNGSEYSGLPEALQRAKQDEYSDDTQPDPGLHPSKNAQGNGAKDPDDCRDHEAFDGSDQKPEQRPQNLPSVERVDGKDIEEE